MATRVGIPLSRTQTNIYIYIFFIRTQTYIGRTSIENQVTEYSERFPTHKILLNTLRREGKFLSLVVSSKHQGLDSMSSTPII